MPVNLSIKDVPDDLAQRLRERAARNHRSLQGELMALVEQATREPSVRQPATHNPLGMQGDACTRYGPGRRLGWKSVQEIYEDAQRRFPVPTPGVPLAVDIIRHDRDTR